MPRLLPERGDWAMAWLCQRARTLSLWARAWWVPSPLQQGRQGQPQGRGLVGTRLPEHHFSVSLSPLNLGIERRSCQHTVTIVVLNLVAQAIYARGPCGERGTEWCCAYGSHMLTPGSEWTPPCGPLYSPHHRPSVPSRTRPSVLYPLRIMCWCGAGDAPKKKKDPEPTMNWDDFLMVVGSVVYANKQEMLRCTCPQAPVSGPSLKIKVVLPWWD